MKKVIFLSLFVFLNAGLLFGQDTLRNRCKDKTTDDTRKTLEQHKKILRQQAGNQEMYYSVGMCYWKLHDPATALPYFDTLIAINPHYEAAFLNRALCKHMLKDKAGACEDLKKCLEYDKDYDGVIGDKSISEFIKANCQ